MHSKLAMLLPVLLLLLVTAMPAHADPAFDTLTVRSQGDSVLIHVVVINSGDQMQQGPLTLQVFVRGDGNSPWTLMKTWSDIDWIQTGEKVTRDYFDDTNPLMLKLAAAGKLHVRVVLSGSTLLAGPLEARKHWKKGTGGAPDNLENLP